MSQATPGTFPYEAGIRPEGYTRRPWTMRQFAGLGSGAETNRRFRYLLREGETGLSVAFDLPTQMGLDRDDERARPYAGGMGVSVSVVDDLAEVFRDIPLDQVSVSFTINATAPVILAMWMVVAEEQGLDPTVLRGTLQNEMLKEFLARKAYIFDLDTSFRYSLDTIEYCVRHLPGVFPVSLSGGHAREAGADLPLEVACALSDARAYIRALRDRGLEVDAFGPRLSFLFGSHMDILAEAAKYRVARRLYARMMAEEFGSTSERSQKMRIFTVTFGSALSPHEPLNNIARATLQCLASVLGGVQSIHVASFDEAWRTPSELSARTALRVQQIIAEETDVTRYPDPLGGSRVIEELADRIEADVRRWMDAIEERGGMLGALRSGWIERQIEELAWRTPGPSVGAGSDLTEAERALLRPDEGTPREPAETGPPPRRGRCPAATLEAVAAAAEEHRNIIPPLVAAARERATLGEMCRALARGAARQHGEQQEEREAGR